MQNIHECTRGAPRVAVFARKHEAAAVSAWRLQVLQDKMRELEERYAGGAEIPKPPFWGGYRIAPTSIEFWNSQPSRTHERLRFRREDGAWVSEVLSP